MPHQGLHTFPTVGIPDEDLRAFVAAAARDQPRAIGAPVHTRDDAVMTRQLKQQLASPGIPHIDVVIFAHTDPPLGGGPDCGLRRSRRATPRARRLCLGGER